MNGSFIKTILLAWLTLPLTALDWAIAWHALPERVVMKFGSNGQPVAWASRPAAMRFDLGLMTGVLVFATAIAFLVAVAAPWKASKGAGAALGVGAFVFLLINGVLWVYQVP